MAAWAEEVTDGPLGPGSCGIQQVAAKQVTARPVAPR